MKEFIRKIWNWIVSVPKDKLLHDYAGELIALYSFAVLILFCKYWPAFAIANAVALAFLIGKEVYDLIKKEGHSVEIADIGYGIFGIIKADIPLLLLGIVLV